MFTIVDCCARCGICCDRLLACSKCKVAKYCSRKCQSIAWKGGHKFLCERISHQSKEKLDDLSVDKVCSIDPSNYEAFEQLYFRTLLGCKKSWRVLLTFATPIGSSPYSSPYACALVAICFKDSTLNFICLHPARVKKYVDMCSEWMKEEALKSDPNPVACHLCCTWVVESMCEQQRRKYANI